MAECRTCWDFCAKSATCYNPFRAVYHAPTGASYLTTRADSACSLYRRRRDARDDREETDAR